MPGYFHLTRRGTQFMFNLRSANHQVILTSERYTAKASAQNGITSVRTNAPHDGRYSRRTSTAGQPYFALLAGNGEVIGTSQMYSTVGARDAGIDACKATAPGATVLDES